MEDYLSGMKRSGTRIFHRSIRAVLDDPSSTEWLKALVLSGQDCDLRSVLRDLDRATIVFRQIFLAQPLFEVESAEEPAGSGAT